MQTWKDYDVPERWKETVDESKRLMPDWEYNLTSDDDNRKFVEQYYPRYLEVYDNAKYNIMRADMTRYMWLHKYGGFYYDLDLCPTMSLDIIYKRAATAGKPSSGVFLIQSGNTKSVYTNSFLASSPGEQFWISVMEDIKSSIEGWNTSIPTWAMSERHLYVLYITGPNLITRVAKAYSTTQNGEQGGFPSMRNGERDDEPGRTLVTMNGERDGARGVYPVVDISDVGVNLYSTCDLENYDEIKDRVLPYWKPESIFRPLPGSSWVGLTGKAAMWCNCNRGKLYTFVIIVIIILIILFLLWKNPKWWRKTKQPLPPVLSSSHLQPDCGQRK